MTPSDNNQTTHTKIAGQDKYQFHDYYLVDELLTDEHKLIRESVILVRLTQVQFFSFFSFP